MSALTQSPAWQELLRHATVMKQKSLTDIVQADDDRIDNTTIRIPGMRLVYALNRVEAETITILTGLAEQQGLAGWRERLFSGDKINTTEKRAVLHTALRQDGAKPVVVDGHNVMDDIIAVRRRMASFVDDVQKGKWRGTTGRPIRHIVNIGIGGSDLGPRLVVNALEPFSMGPTVHFVANVDAYDLLSTLKNLDAEETLFVVVSKTFTTQETLMNAQTARRWLVDRLGESAVAQHFVAVSVNREEVSKFGIDTANMFPMWDWVGGRFSVWSAVGLSVALAIGMERFEKFLSGARAMDEHFCTAPLNKNIPVLLALLGVWNRNFMGAQAQAVLPYSERLRDFPRFLQQLEMESNGKSVTRDGRSIDYSTVPVIFGDRGSISQHSFHQCLHQGTDVIPVDFIGVASDDLGQPQHHTLLIANMLAQAGAFAFGQLSAASPHDVYPGNRSGNIIMLDQLDPFGLGLLLALYEHKTFVQGVIWELNSFDQPGVELGKRMARQLEKPAASDSKTAQFLSSLRHYLEKKS